MTRERIVIQNIEPQLDGGDFFIKRIVGEIIEIKADVFGDGHDVIQAEICFKSEKDSDWSTVRLTSHPNDDVYTGAFYVEQQGFYEYKINV